MIWKESHVVLLGNACESAGLRDDWLGGEAELLNGRAEAVEEPLERAAGAGGYADDPAVVALHAVGVGAVLGHEAEVAGGEQLLLLLALGVLDEEPDGAGSDVEDLVGVSVQVSRDEVALGAFDGEEVEGVLGLLAAGVDGDQIAEKVCAVPFAFSMK